MPMFVAAAAAAATAVVETAGAVGSFMTMSGALTFFGGAVTAGQALSVAVTAASYGVQWSQQQRAASSARRRQLAEALGSPQRQTVRGSTAPRCEVFGRTTKAGTVAFVEAYSSTAYRLDVLCEGPVTFEAFYFGNVRGRLDPAGNVIAPDALLWQADPYTLIHAWTLEAHAGTAFQAVSPALSLRFPEAFTAAAQLKGVAYLVAQMRSTTPQTYSRIYPSGIMSTVSATLRGGPVWDPRLGGDPAMDSAWSRSPALAALRVLTATTPVGRPIWFGLPADLIDANAFAAAADHDSEEILQLDGLHRPRFACDGVLDYTAEPRHMIETVLDCAAYRIFLTGDGRVTIRGGEMWSTPAQSIGPDEIVSVVEYQRGASAWDRVNEIRPTFTCAELRGEPVEAEAVISAAAPPAADVVSEIMHLPFVTSHDQARRLAAIELAERAAPVRLRLALRISALRLWDEEGVLVTLPSHGLAEPTPFRIEGRQVDGSLSSLEVALVQWAGPPAWGEDEWVSPPDLPVDTSVDTLIATPIGVTVASEGLGADEARLLVGWDIFGGESGQTPIVEWRAVGAATWQTHEALPGETETVVGPVPAPLPAGAAYEARVHFRTAENGYHGPASTPVSVTALASDSLPGPVTSVSRDMVGGWPRVIFSAPTSPTYVDVFLVLVVDGVRDGGRALTPAAGAASSWTATDVVGAVIGFELATRNARGESNPTNTVTI